MLKLNFNDIISYRFFLSKSGSQQKLHWTAAINKAMSMDDPWSDFPINELDTEIVKRHRYSALRKKWTTDEVQVKIEPTVSVLTTEKLL